MSVYQKEAIKAGATHLGERGHGWVQCGHTAGWYVYKLGQGWVAQEPTSELTPLVQPQSPVSEQWQRVKRAAASMEEAPNHVTIYDLLVEIDKMDAII